MADTDTFSVQEIIAKTAWAEARGEGFNGMQAVVNVIQNRVNSRIKWWGHDFRSVCLKPYQFSCWLYSDPNRTLLIKAQDPTTNSAYADACHLATSTINNALLDITNGATSYYASTMPNAPAWANGKTPVATIGHHIFFVD